jgi:hypothetical protein
LRIVQKRTDNYSSNLYSSRQPPYTKLARLLLAIDLFSHQAVLQGGYQMAGKDKNSGGSSGGQSGGGGKSGGGSGGGRKSGGGGKGGGKGGGGSR